MRKRVWILSFLIAVAISLVFFTLHCFSKEELQRELDVKIIAEKIDKVLRNQEEIIKRLIDIRQELDIIRVRASRR